MLDSEYETHISDFGMAKFLNSNSSNKTSLAGTPRYMAPGLRIQSFLLKDVLDQRLPHPTHRVAKEVISIARIAFACLSKDPDCRPTMEQASSELEMPISASYDQFHFHTIALGQLQWNR